MNSPELSFFNPSSALNLVNVKIIQSKIEISEKGSIIPKIGIFDKDTLIEYEICLGQFYKKIVSKEFKVPTIQEIENGVKNTARNRKIKQSIYKYTPYNDILQNATIKFNTEGYSQNKRDSIYKRIKIKLGLTLIKIKEDSTKSYKIKFINDKKAQNTLTLNKKENKINL